MADLPDFEGLARELLSDCRNILPRWLPGGRLVGREYTCGNLRGEPGESFKVNVNTGRWADFAGIDKGGDLISLYAAIEGISQGDAFKQLSEDTGFNLRVSSPYNPDFKPLNKTPEFETTKPPIEELAPSMNHPQHGPADSSWCYLDFDGTPLFYIARYDVEPRKQIVPWAWSVHGGWVMKGYPTPRPLYGLDQLSQNPDLPVLVVEGEKAADAAKQLVEGRYVVITWPNGTNSVRIADWEPLAGRKILIWPDADAPGLKAANEIAELLAPNCPQIKIIDPSDVSAGFDAHDALMASWDWPQFKAWALDRVRIFSVNVPPLNLVRAMVQDEAAEIPSAILAAMPDDKTTVEININQDSDEASESTYSLWEKYGIVVTKQGQPICNADNVIRVFEKSPSMQGLVWYDEFHDKHFTSWNSDRPREWQDIDTMKLTHTLQRTLGLSRLSNDTVHHAVMVYAERTITNEPRDWMNRLAWDGQPRIADFFINCFGMQESDYAKAASRNWWISMAARILSPGCKVDTMIILQGSQGKFKSTALSIIGGAWFAEAQESPLSKDFYMALHGKLIIEVSEMDSFKRAEDTLIKRLLSCEKDRFRPPYGRASRDFKRQCVFVGTTNEETFLKDHTGARRFWPVKVQEIDVVAIRRDREQLFAESVHYFKEGLNCENCAADKDGRCEIHSWWKMPADQTAEQQESFRQVDEWENVISDYCKIIDEVTIKEIAVSALKIDIAKLDLLVQRRIGKILRTLRWTHHNLKAGDSQQKTWRSPKYYYRQHEF